MNELKNVEKDACFDLMQINATDSICYCLFFFLLKRDLDVASRHLKSLSGVEPTKSLQACKYKSCINQV